MQPLLLCLVTTTPLLCQPARYAILYFLATPQHQRQIPSSISALLSLLQLHSLLAILLLALREVATRSQMHEEFTLEPKAPRRRA